MADTDAIMREYEEAQNRNRDVRRKHLQEVYDRVPAVKDVDLQLQQLGVTALMYVKEHPETDKNVLKARLQKKQASLHLQRDQLLLEAGYPRDYTDLHYDCEICHDTGFTEETDPVTGRVTTRHCRCYEQKIMRGNLLSSNLSSLLKKQNFASFRLDRYSRVKDPSLGYSPRDAAEKAFQWLFGYCEQFPHPACQNIYLYGPVGTGKTFLSCCVAKALLDTGWRVLYLSADSLCKALADERFSGAGTDESVHKKAALIRDCSLLIIDDLGREAMTSNSGALLLECLNDRLINEKAVMINSNLSITEAAENYSDRFTSRILGNYKIIDLIGKDLRLPQVP